MTEYESVLLKFGPDAKGPRAGALFARSVFDSHQPPEMNYLGRFENDDSPCSIASAEAFVQGKSVKG